MGVGARGILKALTSSQGNSQKAGLGPAGEAGLARKASVPHELDECIAMEWLLALSRDRADHPEERAQS